MTDLVDQDNSCMISGRFAVNDDAGLSTFPAYRSLLQQFGSVPSGSFLTIICISTQGGTDHFPDILLLLY